MEWYGLFKGGRVKLLIIIGIVGLLLLAGCVDNTTAIKHCDSLGLAWTGKFMGSNIECINVTSQQLFVYAADFKFIGR